MSRLPFVVLSLPVVLAGAGCATDASEPDDPAPIADEAQVGAEVSAPTRITIDADNPLALVSYREAFDTHWQPATATAAGNRYIAKVHGPYWVTAVCVSDVVFDGSVVAHTIDIEQFAR
ncbi:MAG TPA: hypothetical protein VGC42_31650, partial [Kofleriaceae bacterium]